MDSRREHLRRLEQRHRVIRSIRSVLDDDGFLEIQSPLLVPGTCPDVAVDSFRVQTPQGGDVGYLVTSTEYQLKRLLAAGIPRLYSLTQNFRPHDRSERHNPEFTMVEWARLGAELRQIETDAERMVVKAWEALGRPALQWSGRPIVLDGGWERRTVKEVLEQVCDQTIGAWDLESLNRASAEVTVPEDFRKDLHDLLSYLLAEAEGFLGSPRPTWVVDWPAVMTASAGLHPDDPTIALRSELYMAGLEIADGFPFLRDVEKQHELFERDLQRRRELGRPTVALDRRFLEELGALQPGAGMALGVDRLVMMLTGSACLDEVLAFGWEDR